MATDVKTKYGAEGNLTITSLNSLATDASAPYSCASSAEIDNDSISGGPFLDFLVSVEVTFPNSAPADLVAMLVYAYARVNANYTSDGLSSIPDGTDKAVDLAEPSALAYLGLVPIAQDKLIKSRPFSVALAFGGVLPKRWGVVVHNRGGQTLASSGNAVRYTPILGQTV